MTTQTDGPLRARPIDAKEARECLSRFVASHFRDGRETARFSIPANVSRDDDLLLGQFIDDADATARALDDSQAECARLRKALSPFARMADAMRDREDSTSDVYSYCGANGKASITIADLNEARAAIDAQETSP